MSDLRDYFKARTHNVLAVGRMVAVDTIIKELTALLNAELDFGQFCRVIGGARFETSDRSR